MAVSRLYQPRGFPWPALSGRHILRRRNPPGWPKSTADSCAPISPLIIRTTIYCTRFHARYARCPRQPLRAVLLSSKPRSYPPRPPGEGELNSPTPQRDPACCPYLSDRWPLTAGRCLLTAACWLLIS